MVKTRVGNWMVAHPQGLSFSFAVIALLFCTAVLLLQPGCQKASQEAQTPLSTSSPVVQAQPAASEKAAAEAPAVSESQPAPSAPPESQAPAQQQPVAGTPKMELKTILQDSGDVGPEMSRTAQFEFKNVGDARLNIVRLSGCCGSVVSVIKDGRKHLSNQIGDGGAAVGF
ncbi:MAG: hypothetical protein EHM35_18105, partial [Planctomycetaceae bacterium]